MKIVLQRVTSASVEIDGQLFSSIGKGIMLLVGVHGDDSNEKADFLADKCINLRIFPDEEGKMNRSLLDIQGEILAVSQFTLFGDCSKGRRPSFIEAAPPETGAKIYDYFVAKLREKHPSVKTGVFGADMQVQLVNDGPVTLLLDR